MLCVATLTLAGIVAGMVSPLSAAYATPEAAPVAAPRAAGAIDLSRRIIDTRIALDAVAATLSHAESALEQAEQAVSDHTRALAGASTLIESLASAYSRRTSEMYIVGGSGVLESLSQSGSVDVLAERLSYLERLRASEQGSLERLIALRRNAGRESAALDAARSAAATALRDLTERRAQLDGLLHEYESLLGLRNLTSGRVSARASRSALPGFRCPVAGPHALTSNFGEPRRGGPHQGNDLPADTGTPVVSVLTTRVVDVVRGGWMGNGVIVRDSAGSEYWYAHLSSVAVRTGQTLSPGGSIGKVGCTGTCTGPHLHFEYHPRGGAAVDPFKILRAVC